MRVECGLRQTFVNGIRKSNTPREHTHTHILIGADTHTPQEREREVKGKEEREKGKLKKGGYGSGFKIVSNQ